MQISNTICNTCELCIADTTQDNPTEITQDTALIQAAVRVNGPQGRQSQQRRAQIRTSELRSFLHSFRFVNRTGSVWKVHCSSLTGSWTCPGCSCISGKPLWAWWRSFPWRVPCRSSRTSQPTTQRAQSVTATSARVHANMNNNIFYKHLKTFKHSSVLYLMTIDSYIESVTYTPAILYTLGAGTS